MTPVEKPGILVVDDQPANLLSMEALLASSDFEEIKACEVVLASSGNEALKLALRGEFALILLDVQMPGMNGFETAELLRSSKRTRQIPIVFLTAIDKEDRHVFRGYDAGAVDYLFKPFEPQILLSKVRVFCELHHARAIIQRQLRELEAAQEVLRFQAAHDPLTKVLNRGAILERLTEELSRSTRKRERLWVALADIDHFKAVNDTHGHQAGDGVLVEFTRRVQGALRGYDALGRYGGEEFLLLVSGSTEAEALAVCERVRAAVAARPVETCGRQIPVTVSIGLSGTVAGDGPEAIKAADEALYRAKEGGRNRVVLAD